MHMDFSGGTSTLPPRLDADGQLDGRRRRETSMQQERNSDDSIGTAERYDE
jgi:hypothetical protein